MKFINSLLALLLCGWISIYYSQGQDLKSMIDRANIDKKDTMQVNLLNSICDSLFRVDPVRTIQYGKQASDLAGEINFMKGRAYAFKYIGMGHFVQGQYVDAMKYFQESLEIFKRIMDRKGTANLLSNIGVIYNNQGNDTRALDLYLQSLKLSEELNDSIRIVTALINIGLIYSKNDATRNNAMDNYQEALRISEKLNYTAGIGTATVNLGELYHSKKDYKEALLYFERSLQVYSAANFGNMSYTLISIGRIYSEMGNSQDAIEYLNEALIIADKNKSKLETGQAYLELGNTHLKIGDTDRALQYFKQSEKISKEIGAINEREKAYKGLSMAYYRKNDINNAYLYLMKENLLKDTILSNIKLLQLNQLQNQYDIETALKENEILKHDAIFQETKNRLLMLIIGVLFFGIILIHIFMILFARANKSRKKTNEELKNKNEMIITQQQAIHDSIIYASRIQNAILPDVELVHQFVPDHFVLFKPRDVVSGDFYWFAKVEDQFIVTVADCTGHGVPGAFMSMLGMSLLKEIILKEYITQPDVILRRLRKEVIQALGQKGFEGEQKDGMDISLCSINTETFAMQWSGANNPCFIIRNGELIKMLPDKMPIGYYTRMDKFVLQEIQLQKNDLVYLFSDGYLDQFGGPDNKKFMTKKFRELLLSISVHPLIEQKDLLIDKLEGWKNWDNRKYEQTDDITILCMKI